MCRVRGRKRRETSSDGLRKVCKKKVTFGKKYQAMEHQHADPEAKAQAPETPAETLARKRRRPRLSREALLPLEQKEKRMKTATEKFYPEQFALACKIIDLHYRHAFHDHTSVVARLRERLENRAKGVVELQLAAEAAERSWECERSEAKRAMCERVLALTQRVAALLDVVELQNIFNELCKRKHMSLPNVTKVNLT